MAKMFIEALTPEEAEYLQKMIDAILKELRGTNRDVDPVVFAQRMADAINAGERDFDRIKALTLGPEAAPARRAN